MTILPILWTGSDIKRYQKYHETELTTEMEHIRKREYFHLVYSVSLTHLLAGGHMPHDDCIVLQKHDICEHQQGTVGACRTKFID
jgi:hypothetical protein